MNLSAFIGGSLSRRARLTVNASRRHDERAILAAIQGPKPWVNSRISSAKSRTSRRREMAELREWFAAFDAEAWDRQFEADVRAGKLDALAEKALQAHASGTTTKL